jgi:transposase
MEKYIVKLTKQEREDLTSLTKTGRHSASKILHARILLRADEGEACNEQSAKTDQEIAQLFDVSERTMNRLRKRFVEEGLQAALARKEHASTRPRKITGEEEARLIAICCSPPPEGSSRWTLKLLSNQLVALEVVESVSPVTVSQVLKKTN